MVSLVHKVRCRAASFWPTQPTNQKKTTMECVWTLLARNGKNRAWSSNMWQQECRVERTERHERPERDYDVPSTEL
jgi:hypothetical protein